jgi:hypothetical protein
LHAENHLGCLNKLRGGGLAITAFDVIAANGTFSVASITFCGWAEVSG